MGGTLITLSDGTIVGVQEGVNTTGDIYVDKDGNWSSDNTSGEKINWKIYDEPITDVDTGKTSTFGDFISGLGSTANTLLDLINKTAQTYENTTGSKIITTSASQVKSTGSLSENDMNTVSMIINSAINQLKKYGLYVGIGIAGIILASSVLKKKGQK